jgi:hypothetical protein
MLMGIFEIAVAIILDFCEHLRNCIQVRHQERGDIMERQKEAVRSGIHCC